MKQENINTTEWDILLTKIGRIGILYAESRALQNKDSHLKLPDWFIPISRYGAALSGNNPSFTGEIYVNTNSVFEWYCSGPSIQSVYTGEIVVILK